MIWKGCVLIIVRVESYERFDWLMGLWGKFAMSTEMFSGLILITGSNSVHFGEVSTLQIFAQTGLSHFSKSICALS